MAFAEPKKTVTIRGSGSASVSRPVSRSASVSKPVSRFASVLADPLAKPLADSLSVLDAHEIQRLS